MNHLLNLEEVDALAADVASGDGASGEAADDRMPAGLAERCGCTDPPSASMVSDAGLDG